MGSKLDKFSKKYGFFTSDASNEEIVAISKELSDVMYDHTKTLSRNAVAMIGVSVGAVIFGLFILTQVSIISGSFKTPVFFIRIAGISMYIAGTIMAFLGMIQAEKAANISTMMWRNVRETASDEKVYEQMLATKTINKHIYTSRNNLRGSGLFLLIGTVLVALAFFIQRLVENGYLT